MVVGLGLWTTVDDRGMTNMAVTCGDIRSSPIHSAYNYDNKILNYCYRSEIRDRPFVIGRSE